MKGKRNASKSLSSLSIIDENEEIELSEGDKAQLNRDRVIFTIEGDKPIGSGSYNCAHFVNGKSEVLRIGYLPDLLKSAQMNKSIIRGVEIVSVFQKYKSILGPSLVEELTRYEIIHEDDLSIRVKGPICKDLLETQKEQRGQNNHFILQHLEYLSGGVFKKEDQKKHVNRDREFYVFSLVWFLCMAEKTFRFQHYDLKGDNIVVRKTNQMQQYNFVYETRTETRYFHFESNLVPVVIDYDFASVDSTKCKRIAPGTLLATSPDALWYQILLRPRFIVKGFQYECDPTSIDWWSLGISILELYFGRFQTYFEKKAEMYYGIMLQHHNLPDTTEWYRLFYGLFFSCCVASLFSSETGIPNTVMPPSEWYPRTNELFPDKYIFSMQDNWEYVAIHGYIEKFKDTPVIMLLRDILHWDVNRRTKNKNPTLHLARFKHTLTPRANTIYQYQAKDSMKPVDLSHIKQLDAPICASCSISTNIYLCPCCHQTFCSTQCQKEKH